MELIYISSFLCLLCNVIWVTTTDSSENESRNEIKMIKYVAAHSICLHPAFTQLSNIAQSTISISAPRL